MFLNDYNDLAHPKIMEELLKIQKGHPGYGRDKLTEDAINYIKRDLETKDAGIYFIPGGTMTNILVAEAVLRPYEAILAAETAHIEGHEAGSIEALGHKILSIKTEDGKLFAKQVRNFSRTFKNDYQVKPGMVYISNTSEVGTYYSKDELTDLFRVCEQEGLFLFIDGARLSVAMAKAGIKAKDMKNLCHGFSFGATKNGALFGEALVFFKEDLGLNFRRIMKRRGAMMAKGFLLGSQFKTLFEDGLYYENGRIAQDMADYLIMGLENLGIKFAEKPQTNQIFIELDKKIVDELKLNYDFEIVKDEMSQNIIRLVTNYTSTREEINEFLQELATLLGQDLDRGLLKKSLKKNLATLCFEYDNLKTSAILGALEENKIYYEIKSDKNPNSLGVYVETGSSSSSFPTEILVDEEDFERADEIYRNLFARA